MYDDDEDPFPAPEPYQVPKDAKKIKERIRRYERALEQEKRRLGNHRDGSGKRFLLGPLYMILGDLEGALKSFAWFEATFPDGADGRDTEAGNKQLRSSVCQPTVGDYVDDSGRFVLRAQTEGSFCFLTVRPWARSENRKGRKSGSLAHSV
jgi:hypothetical protein